MMKNKAVHLAGSALRRRRRACGFFHDRNGAWDRRLHIVDAGRRAGWLAGIEKSAIDVAAAERSGPPGIASVAAAGVHLSLP